MELFARNSVEQALLTVSIGDMLTPETVQDCDLQTEVYNECFACQFSLLPLRAGPTAPRQHLDFRRLEDVCSAAISSEHACWLPPPSGAVLGLQSSVRPSVGTK